MNNDGSQGLPCSYVYKALNFGHRPTMKAHSMFFN